MTEFSQERAEAMARSVADRLDDLAATTGGRVIRPEDPAYDDARRVWNGLIDAHPLVVAEAIDADDVRAILETARALDRGVAVRAGGHSGAGLSTADGAVVLDLSPMNEVTVDPETRTARVEGGATLGDLDEATQAAGLATPTGIVSETGFAGLALGGGTGWLTRKYGLASDRLASAEVMTVAGRRVTASAERTPDLFRALQGGGGNFGVVLSFAVDLVPLDHDVVLADAWYPIDALEGILADCADRLGTLDPAITVSPVVTSRPDDPSTLAVEVLATHVGDPRSGERALRSLLADWDPASLEVEALPYVDLQRRFDEDAVEGDRYHWRAIAVDELTPAVRETFAERARGAPGVRDSALVWPMGGAVGSVEPTATAFYQRAADAVFTFEAAWRDPADDDREIEWVEESVSAVRDLEGAVLPNFAGTDRDGETAREIYGPNVEWLRDVKTAWDPENRLGPSGRIDPR